MTIYKNSYNITISVQMELAVILRNNLVYVPKL